MSERPNAAAKTGQSGPPEGSPTKDSGAEAGIADFAERLREWVKSLLGQRPTGESLREGLAELLQEHAPGETPIAREERTLLANILKVGGIRVGDVEVPRAEIVALEEDADLEAAIAVFHESGHSRLPVYRDTLDQVIGMVHIKDLVPYRGGAKPFRLADIVRKVLFVPPSMPVLDLLLQMRARRTHLALVVDEYGGVDGLVTIEDMVEQIVGEIHDEHEEVDITALIERPGGVLEADARCPIADLENRIGCSLLSPERTEEVDTLGGLVFALIGRIPARGELIQHPCGIAFEVVEADPRRLKRLRVRNIDKVKTGQTQ
jgi:CBS domain containing-hemolysin-like protein